RRRSGGRTHTRSIAAPVWRRRDAASRSDWTKSSLFSVLRRPVIVAMLALVAVATAVAVAFAAFGNRARYKTTDGARVITFGLRSRLLGRTLVETAVVPNGAGRGRPLLVLLHGRSMATDGLLSDPFFRALRRLGARAPV